MGYVICIYFFYIMYIYIVYIYIYMMYIYIYTLCIGCIGYVYIYNIHIIPKHRCSFNVIVGIYTDCGGFRVS